MTNPPREIAAMSFEEALAELEQIVQKLEGGRAQLDESIALYTRGTALKAHCETKLKAAQAQIDRIVVGPDGLSTEAFGET